MKTKKLSRSKVTNSILSEDYYGGHEIFTGAYNKGVDQTRIWTQIGDDGESNGGPALDIIVTDDTIRIDSGDPNFTGSWEIPVYMKDLNKIVEEVTKVMNDFYSQWIEQPRFIKKLTAISLEKINESKK